MRDDKKPYEIAPRRVAPRRIAVIGGGPAGLMAAEMLASAGHCVTVYDHKPSLARKFLMAGRGGLNLTHSEPLDKFLPRYGAAQEKLADAIQNFTPTALQQWCEDLGEPTFTGSSGRIFPTSFKASPLLRAWLARLEQSGVAFKLNNRWRGWDVDNNLLFQHGDQDLTVKADATLLALGGASWPRLGSDGSWTEILTARDIAVSPLRPSNCGFVTAWSDLFKDKFAGQPLKPVILSIAGQSVQGEIMMTEGGIEGGAVYALSSLIRQKIEQNNIATVTLDLRPGMTADSLTQKLSAPRRGLSFTNFLRKAGGLSPLAIALVMERTDRKKLSDDMPPDKLAQLIKALPLRLTAPFAIDRAISSAGGIAWQELNADFMLAKLPGIFVAGEMVDWEAPTGGYLLQACFATGVAAARGVQDYLTAH